MTARYVELFAGAGGLSRGLEAAGFAPMAHCEINDHARAVLRYRWPDVPLHGDVAAIDGRSFQGATLISGGSPCQDLSVAGKRAGLEGDRSGLFYEQVRIWTESGATYCLWENVYGALSSNAGRDFAAVLSAFVGSAVDVPEGGWRRAGVAAGSAAVAAWRVLDLQQFGPPQRRVRVFVLVARAGGVDPAEVLDVGPAGCQHTAPRENPAGAWWNGGGIVPSLDHSGIVKQQTMPEKQRLWALIDRTWRPVAFSPGEDEPCAVCGEEYGDCACPGPTQDFAYRETADGTLEAFVPWLRRLTPRETERLMSWPDDWTRYGINEAGKPYELADTARFRLVGNGVGSVCVEWIAKRLAAAIGGAA
jgi:DNA (cytosine-5)-methyltransferase 1